MGSMELLPGTLELLILRALAQGPAHGYGIAQKLRQRSQDILQVGESSLYPALQRVLRDGAVTAAWGASENNRRARYYTLTPAGRRRMERETTELQSMLHALHQVLQWT